MAVSVYVGFNFYNITIYRAIYYLSLKMRNNDLYKNTYIKRFLSLQLG